MSGQGPGDPDWRDSTAVRSAFAWGRARSRGRRTASSCEPWRRSSGWRRRPSRSRTGRAGAKSASTSVASRRTPCVPACWPVWALTRGHSVPNPDVMPIYEYACGKCGVIEVSQRLSDPALQKCPNCRRKVQRLISSTSFQLKGSGWYVTDYARGGAGKKDAGKSKGGGDSKSGGDKSGDKGSGSSAADSASSTKSDAKQGSS